MKVETLTTAAGRFTWRPGDIIEVTNTEADELIACGAVRRLEVAAPPPPVPEFPAAKKRRERKATSAAEAAQPRTAEE